ncbi:MAG: cytochrome c [Gammaproteobacteria bacterium]|nr:cytochrome c [Gammaproteobacteria bacterium]
MARKQLSVATLGLVCGLMFVGMNAQAGDAKAGKEKSALCAGCHGADGISLTPDIPNLAGQKEAYIVKAIGYYKSGERKNPMMASMVGGLSATDMADLAAFFSSLK